MTKSELANWFDRDGLDLIESIAVLRHVYLGDITASYDMFSHGDTVYLVP